MFWAFLHRNPNDFKSLTTMYWLHMDNEGRLEKIQTKKQSFIIHKNTSRKCISVDHVYKYAMK